MSNKVHISGSWYSRTWPTWWKNIFDIGLKAEINLCKSDSLTSRSSRNCVHQYCKEVISEYGEILYDEDTKDWTIVFKDDTNMVACILRWS